jgi:hypothetical protein
MTHIQLNTPTGRRRSRRPKFFDPSVVLRVVECQWCEGAGVGPVAEQYCLQHNPYQV